MNRFITFLDILGFGDLVETKSLAEVKQRMETAMVSIQLAKTGGVHPPLPELAAMPARIFSFSDTFVIVSEDLSEQAVSSYIITSVLLTQYLFAQCLGVRGAMTYGEADYIPHTEHLVGKGIVAAAMLEKKQDWLGVVVDLPSMPAASQNLFDLPLLAPLFVRWNVPLKDGQTLPNALVVNWRYNLKVEGGTKSLLGNPPGAPEQQKVQNTLTFAKHLVDTNRHVGKVVLPAGKSAPWLNGCTTSSQNPAAGWVHGDEY